MGVPTSEVGYTSAMPRREDHEVRKGHVGALDKKKDRICLHIWCFWKSCQDTTSADHRNLQIVKVCFLSGGDVFSTVQYSTVQYSTVQYSTTPDKKRTHTHHMD